MTGTPSTPAQLLASLDALGVQLLPEGNGGLAVDGPRETLTPRLLEQLRASKPQLLALLRQRPQTAEPEATESTETSANGPGRLPTPARKPLDSQQATDARRFTNWVRRPDVNGRMGWEQPGLSEGTRWWARWRFPDPPKPGDCPRCGSTAYVDTPIHGGRSKRRDCAKCGRFICFPIWYGKDA